MKEIETTFYPEGLVYGSEVISLHVSGRSHVLPKQMAYWTTAHDVTVGLMRLYEDAENVDSTDYWREMYGELLRRAKTQALGYDADVVPIPKAEGKVSVRPYVRGKPRKKLVDTQKAIDEGILLVHPSQIEPLQGDSEGFDGLGMPNPSDYPEVYESSKEAE